MRIRISDTGPGFESRPRIENLEIVDFFLFSSMVFDDFSTGSVPSNQLMKHFLSDSSVKVL